ncbi:MAG: hypothetical protein NZM06_07625 [Chloroherpetonaceae bacterium]|nr:hypothetical protein [Chloroherpetonaceae bacterium]
MNKSVRQFGRWLLTIGFIALSNAGFAQDFEDEEDDQEIYAERFRNAQGIAGSIGLTTTSFIVSGSYVRLFNPDWIGFAAFSMTSRRDPKEAEKIVGYGISVVSVVYDSETGAEKKNSLLIMPITLGIQRRLFREDITSSFRPFVEAGVGPTVGYVYSYSGGFFGGGYLKLGFNGFVGAGAYFGSNPLSLQGLTIRYHVDAFANGIELLPNRFRNAFHGVSLSLILGTFFL